MRILFINALNESRRDFREINMPAAGVLYLASYLEKYGGFGDIHVLATGHVDESLLKSIKPDIVGVSAVTQNFEIAKGICAGIKKIMDIPIIMGGVHISTNPQSLASSMDVGVIGEGEETMLELVLDCERMGYPGPDTKGTCFRDNGRLIINPRRGLITPLDVMRGDELISGIPFPARHLIHFEPFQYHILLTSRGCPFDCRFCSPYAMWRTVRYHSPEYVVSEIRQIYDDYHPKMIGINDDLFAINKKRLAQIAALIKKEKFYGALQFYCFARANLMDDETAKLLKAMGVTSIDMGLESGSPRTLNYLKGSSVTVDDNRRAIDVIADNGIEAVASFIIGSPSETEEEMLQTLDFIKKSRLSYFNVGQLLPFPGTKVWDEYKAKGIVSDDMDWGAFDYTLGQITDPRIYASMLPADKLKKVFSLFYKERARRLRRKVILFGLRNPRWLLEFAQRKYRLWQKFRSINTAGVIDG